MDHIERLLAEGLASYGLDESKAPLLARYGELLLEKNRVMDLTALETPEAVATLHMLDCAALCSRWDFSGRRVVDVGSGAGFPGLVIALLCPAAEVTLLDPLQKRLDFLADAASALGTDNVTCLHARAEDAGRDGALRETFDFAAARAVADMTVLSELCLPLVRVGGAFLAMKSVGSLEEAEAAAPLIETLGGAPGPCWDYSVYGTDVTHRVWPVEKVSPTPARYPRRWSRIVKGKLGK